MVKILLICSAGMSTSLLVKKMQANAEERGIDVKIWSCSEIDMEANIPQADIVLLGPQVRFMYNRIKCNATDQSVMIINTMLYGTMDGAGVLNQALGIPEEKE